MSTKLTVVCDRCGSESATFRNPGQKVFLARAALCKGGWTCNNRSGKDYCPTCAKARAEASRGSK